jgi:scyllo-inositol 2-dehydrogenase (NAD+)
MKAAVIGCGRMGVFTSPAVQQFAPPCWFPLSHAEAIARHPALDLAGLCDADAGTLARARAACGDVEVFSDHRALLTAIQPAIVGIATRTPGRVDIIADCIAAGARALHVEKPLCNTMAELDRLEMLFARDDVFITYGAIRRHFAIYDHARTLAASGAFGKLLEVRVNMGSGALYWTHPHSVDLILWAAGDRIVTAVQATLGNIKTGRTPHEIRTDPIIESATIHFEDGVAGHIGRAPGCDLLLACETAEIAVTNDGRTIRINAVNGDDPYPALTTIDWQEPAIAQGILAPISQLVDCLQGNKIARAANAALKRDVLVGQRCLFGFVQSNAAGSIKTALDGLDSGMAILAESNGRAA